jgi:hypothetical protein
MGAPKGNTNALRHGLYAKHFSPTEQAELKKMSPEDYRHELFMMRVAVKNLFNIQQKLYEKMQGLLNSDESTDGSPDESTEVDRLTKISNSLSLAITALNATARTYALFNGTDTSVNNAFEDAINSLTIFMEDPLLGEPRAKEEEDEEVLALPEGIAGLHKEEVE